jgi:putative oxidoreductase
MSNARDIAALIGRILIAIMYIPAGFSKIGGFAGTSGYIASKGLPLPTVLAFGAAAVEVIGGIALAVGLQTRVAALVLAAFTVIATFIFHNYWALPADQQMVQQLMFMKNLAITGGLLFVFALGAGSASVDARLGARRAALA